MRACIPLNTYILCLATYTVLDMQDILKNKVDEKDEILVSMLSKGYTSKEIACHIGRSQSWVSTRLKKLGIDRNYRTPKDKIAKIRSLYSEGVKPHKIAGLLGVEKQLVFKFVKDLTKQGCRTHTVDDNFLDIIGLEQAYFIGFMLADGYVNLKTNRLQIGLSIKDIEVLRKFKAMLKTSNPIHTIHSKTTYGYSYIAILHIVSKKLALKCKSLGIAGYKNTKTLDLASFPTEITNDDTLFLACLRGFWDGDGWVSKKDSNREAMELIGPTKLCKFLKSQLKIRFDIGSSIKKEKRTKANMSTLRLFGENFRRLYLLLKPFNFGLLRKFSI